VVKEKLTSGNSPVEMTPHYPTNRENLRQKKRKKNGEEEIVEV
jgi:hypothetical protein